MLVSTFVKFTKHKGLFRNHDWIGQ